MANVWQFKCDKCDFSFPEGMRGMDIFVKDNAGNKIICPPGQETTKAMEILGVSRKSFDNYLLHKRDNIPAPELDLIEKRLGYDYESVCQDCLNIFKFSPKTEPRKCPKCGSENVKTRTELQGQLCPKCKVGVLNTVSFES